MKIAIMTQPLGHNYGGIMQAWALQQVLKGMGHEPVTIDRQPAPPSFAYQMVRKAYRVLKGKTPTPSEAALADISRHLRSFTDEHIVMSPTLNSTAKLRAHFMSTAYQGVVVGSDQTWRPKYSPNIYNFFLDFLTDTRIRRISYASSFGVDNWEFSPKETKRCAKLAQQFAFISVRETSGIELCAKHLGVKAQAVLDPTLLLTKDDYIALLEKNSTRPTPKGGLYTYFLDKSPKKDDVAQQLAVKAGLNTFKRQADRSIQDWETGATGPYLMPPVTDWLSGFYHANFVVTDSFHGMVFSIIFGKPFMVILNPDRGSARFESLLSQLGMSDRLMSESDPIPHAAPPTPCTSYTETLASLRALSLGTLLAQLK